MTSSTDYVEAVQQIGYIAGRVCLFLTKIVQSGICTMPVDVNNWNRYIVGCRCWMPWYDWFTLDSFCSSQHVWSNKH